MPSKCGILNLGISHKIFPTLPRLFLHQYVSTLLSFLTQCFPNTLPTYLGVLCGCVVCGCLFVWLCGSWLCVWWHQCGRAIVVHCVPASCVARRADNRGGGELVSGIGPYPASEEIDRRPLISCRAVPIGKKSSSSDERAAVCQVGISCGNFSLGQPPCQAVTIVQQ